MAYFIFRSCSKYLQRSKIQRKLKWPTKQLSEGAQKEKKENLGMKKSVKTAKKRFQPLALFLNRIFFISRNNKRERYKMRKRICFCCQNKTRKYGFFYVFYVLFYIAKITSFKVFACEYNSNISRSSVTSWSTRRNSKKYWSLFLFLRKRITVFFSLLKSS